MMKRILLCLFMVLAAAAAGRAADPLPTRGLSVDAAGHIQRPAGTLRLDDPAFGGTLPTARLSADVPRALATEAAAAVDSRLAGLTASDATVKLFSIQDDSGAAGNYVRSATCWVRDLDLSCISVYSTGITTSHWETGTAISPRHVLLAVHFWPGGNYPTNAPAGTPPTAPGNGATLRFVTAGNVTLTRTITMVQQVPGTDLLVGKLDSDLPATISPAKVLPANYAGAGALVGAPVIHTNRYQQVSVKVIASSPAAGNNLAEPPTTDTQRRAFDIPVATGDSSHPVFVVLGCQPVLLGDFHYVNGGDSLVGNFAAINAAMTALGGGYQLTPASVPTAALGNVATLVTGIAPGQVPVVGSGGTLDPAIIPATGGGVPVSIDGDHSFTGNVEFDGNVNFAGGTIILNGGGDVVVGLNGSILVSSEAEGTLSYVPTAAGQSVRRNAANTALEAYTPLALGGSATTAAAGNHTHTPASIGAATAAQGAKADTAVQPSTAPVLTGTNFTAIPEAGVTNLVSHLAAKAADSTVVHKTGDETIAGNKTLTGTLTVAAILPGAIQFDGTQAQDSDGNSLATSILAIINGNFVQVNVTAGQSVRLNGAGNDYEAYTAPALVAVPATATSAGVPGQVAYSSTFYYVCTAANTWRRVAIASW